MKQHTNKQRDMPCLLLSSLSIYRDLHCYEEKEDCFKSQRGNVSPARHLSCKNSLLVLKRHCVTIQKDFKDNLQR